MSSSPQSDELHLTLNARYEELVRAFARESLLSDAAPTEAASSLAESTLALWRLLCRHAGDERVRLLPFHSGKDAGMRFVLHGYSRFSALAASHGSITPKAEIGKKVRFADGREVTYHSLEELRSIRVARSAQVSLARYPTRAPR
jgi:hypothetical protein